MLPITCVAAIRCRGGGWLPPTQQPDGPPRWQQACRRRHCLAAAAGGTQLQTTVLQPPAASYDLSTWTQEELEQNLQWRQLRRDGSREEMEDRLGSFLADPAAFPGADCRARPVIRLSGRLFGTRVQLRSHIQLLLGLLQNEEIRAGHPDFPFLLALLQQHPRYAEKVTHKPVVAFRVQTVEFEDQSPARMFEYMDGRQEWEDFSYRKCIGLGPDHNAALNFRDAMRCAVMDQLSAYRHASTVADSQGRQVYICESCKRWTPTAGKLRLEHVWPNFNQLIKGFCDSTTLAVPAVDGKLPGTNRSCFTDEAWIAAWRKYHRQNVRSLRLICLPCTEQRGQARRLNEQFASGAAQGGRR